jgi:hypothetical protein
MKRIIYFSLLVLTITTVSLSTKKAVDSRTNFKALATDPTVNPIPPTKINNSQIYACHFKV